MVEVGFFVQQNNPVSENVNQNIGPKFYQENAILAESLGYDSFWFPDHWLLERNRAALDCWTVLTAAAATTHRIRIGSLVTPVTAYSPFILAKKAVTLQMVSKERLQMGLGAGWHRQEYLAAGLTFDSHRVRLQKLEETITLLNRLWTAESSFDFKGTHYSAAQALLKPHIGKLPLWLGGASDKLLDLTGKYADGWVAFELHRHDLVRKIEYVQSVLDREGRRNSKFSLAMAVRVAAAKNSQDAVDISSRLGLKSSYTATDLPKGLQGHLLIGSFEDCASE
jgi:alkanesulfonate monooxygenase SsuD/methylene tetrahydromethanopterin reductase-like flavin-dependent oxidoreductase (luciferase family)